MEDNFDMASEINRRSFSKDELMAQVIMYKSERNELRAQLDSMTKERDELHKASLLIHSIERDNYKLRESNDMLRELAISVTKERDDLRRQLDEFGPLFLRDVRRELELSDTASLDEIFNAIKGALAELRSWEATV